MADIRANRVSDPDGDLLGTLLTELYPDELSAADIWKYLSVPTNRMRFGRYGRFWSQTLGEPSAHSQITEHLNALAARPEVVVPALQSIVTRNLAVNLLARGLETHGEEVETKRLYDWLGVGLVPPAGQYPPVGDGPRPGGGTPHLGSCGRRERADVGSGVAHAPNRLFGIRPVTTRSDQPPRRRGS